MKKATKQIIAYYAYIVECRDGTYYAGYTTDLDNRLKAHNDGKGAKYTRGKGPVRVVWSKKYECLTCAMKAEYKIKQLNRKQKQMLVDGVDQNKVFGSDPEK